MYRLSWKISFSFVGVSLLKPFKKVALNFPVFPNVPEIVPRIFNRIRVRERVGGLKVAEYRGE